MKIDDETLEKIKKENEVDNSRFEEVMSREMTLESQNEFLMLFKESQLFMQVTEFRLQDVLDATQNLWMCGAQPFYEDGQ